MNEQRADLFEKIIKEVAPKDRPQWVRQMADTLSAAVQSGSYPKGAERLKSGSHGFGKDPRRRRFGGLRRIPPVDSRICLGPASPERRICQDSGRVAEELEQFVGRGIRRPPMPPMPCCNWASPRNLPVRRTKPSSGIGRSPDDFAGVARREEGGRRDPPARFGRQVDRTRSAGSTTGEQIDLSRVQRQIRPDPLLGHVVRAVQGRLGGIKGAASPICGQRFYVHRREPRFQPRSARRLSRRRTASLGRNSSSRADSTAAIANELGVLTLPTMILIDDTGKRHQPRHPHQRTR